ncbi:hypothetical protein ACH40F_34095 [Streptomyces sp. NPDC020794]|uniref:hypothetical protein n=1 Tax=unclassified Streptomyces TaxID=2593676 RepID=UPI0036E6C0DA
MCLLRDLDMITPHLDEPERDPGTLRYMLQNLGRQGTSSVLGRSPSDSGGEGSFWIGRVSQARGTAV